MPLSLTSPTLQFGIVVRDLDTMLRFYTETLGMTLFRTTDVSGVATIYHLGPGSEPCVKLVVPETPPEDGFRSRPLTALSGLRREPFAAHAAHRLDELHEVGDNITIMRNEEGRTRIFKFNYKNVSKGKTLDQNIQLQPGDTVVVP